MLEEFSFGNFWSFKEVQTLNLAAAKIKSGNALLDLDNLIAVEDDLTLLKSKAIYGANASGKSNIVRALTTFTKIVKSSVKDEKVLSWISPFMLSTATVKKPSFFQIIFRLENVRYRYGFEADENAIKSEWLFSTPKKREQPLFIRENDKIIDINQTHFEEGFKFISLVDGDGEGQIYRSNSLFVSSLASFGFGKISKKIIKFFSSIAIINGLGQQGLYNVASDSLNNDEVEKKFIVGFLKNADVGIESIDSVEIANEDIADHFGEEVNTDLRKGRLIVSRRKLLNDALASEGNANFLFNAQESEGTLKMFELSPFIYRSLNDATILVIDEFDARFHPLLTKKIVELYNSSKNKNAQLIFITHDTNLLSSELLRRDQIDFVEKDKYGASHLYTLVEIKGVRNNALFEKDYIQGKYGAIPFLGNFSNLLNAD